MNVTRKQAFEALLTFEMDFEGPHFTELSEGAQDLIKSLLQVLHRTFHQFWINLDHKIYV